MMKQHNSFAIALDLLLTDAIWRMRINTKTQLILGIHSQKLLKFCFTNPTVSLKEVVNRGKLFEEVDKETGVVEDSKIINEIKNLEKNEQLL